MIQHHLVEVDKLQRSFLSIYGSESDQIAAAMEASLNASHSNITTTCMNILL